MGKVYFYEGCRFEWDENKALKNLAKHGVDFTAACEVFFDPLYFMEQDDCQREMRWRILGYTDTSRLLVVIAVESADGWRIISARPTNRSERRLYEESDGSSQ